MKKIIAYLLIVVSSIGMTNCNSHSGEIDEIKNTLLWGEKGKAGTWRMSYNYYFVDDIDLKAVETMTLKENGEFTEETIYYYKGNPLAKGTQTGEWNIEYDDDLEAYFFNQYYDDKLAIQNLNMNEDWFKRFDTDLRLSRRGDAYDAVEDGDEKDGKLYGIEIIDYNKNLFLVKDLETGSVYRYEPVKESAERAESANIMSSNSAQEGDEACETAFTLQGKIGDYPIEMELTTYEGTIIDARYRYLKTGSGEWINLEIDKDDLGRTLMYESLNGKKVGCLEGRLSVTGNTAEFRGWHKNMSTGKELPLYAEDSN